MIASVQPSMDASSNSSARRRCWLGVGIGAWPTHGSAAWHSDSGLAPDPPMRVNATGRGLLPQRIPLSPSAVAEDDPKQKSGLLMVKLLRQQWLHEINDRVLGHRIGGTMDGNTQCRGCVWIAARQR